MKKIYKILGGIGAALATYTVVGAICVTILHFGKDKTYDFNEDGKVDLEIHSEIEGSYIFMKNRVNNIKFHTYSHDGRKPETKNIQFCTSNKVSYPFPSYIITSKYDSEGRKIRETWDKYGDGDKYAGGISDEIETWKYDEEGREIEFTQDSNGDNVPDMIRTRKYDSKGRIINITEDTDGDGRPNMIITGKYDDIRKEAEVEMDINGDGIPDKFRTEKYGDDEYLEKHLVEFVSINVFMKKHQKEIEDLAKKLGIDPNIRDVE